MISLVPLRFQHKTINSSIYWTLNDQVDLEGLEKKDLVNKELFVLDWPAPEDTTIHVKVSL